jgi:hypothetical protein
MLLICGPKCPPERDPSWWTWWLEKERGTATIGSAIAQPPRRLSSFSQLLPLLPLSWQFEPGLLSNASQEQFSVLKEPTWWSDGPPLANGADFSVG